MKEISFPVYRIPRKPNEDQGVVFLADETRATGDIKIKVIDDLNIQKKTLAERRLALLCKPHIKLYEFKLACFFIADLVKASTHRDYHWIDSNGKIFKYNKETNYKLGFKRITKVIRMPSYTLLELEGIPGRIKTLFPPATPSHVYAAVLTKGPEFIFYGYSESAADSNKFRRKL